MLIRQGSPETDALTPFLYSALDLCRRALNRDLKDDESSAICTEGNPVIYSAARNQTFKSTKISGRPSEQFWSVQRFGEQVALYAHRCRARC